MKPLPLLALLLLAGSLRAATPVPEPPPPVIPPATFPITGYGAVGDGVTINTAAFAKAVAACQAAGGGAVVVPPGKYLTGPFTLGSHMALVVEKGATIQATGTFSDFGLPNPLPATQDALNKFRDALHPLISASNVTDLAIRGDGVIDGAGAPWWAKSDRAARANGGTYVPRPNLIVIRNCTRLRVTGVTLQNSPQFHLVPKLCTDVLIDGVKIYAPPDSPNTDAIDPSNCRNLLIRHVLTDTGDDNVAFKAGHDGPVENNTVTDCTFLHGHGVSVGSETDGGVRNILVQRCTFENTGTAIRIKSSRTRGGLVQDVTYRDITMKNVDQAIYINLFYDDKSLAKFPQPKPVTPETPMVRDILISNVTCVNAKAAGEITGLPEAAATNITLENIHVTAWTGFNIQDAKGLNFKDVSFTTSPKPPEPSPSPAASPALSGTLAKAAPTPILTPLTAAQKAAAKTGSVTVAADGSGDFTSVQAAVISAPDEPQGAKPFLIHIKPGAYREVVTIPVQKGAISFEGEDPATTKITYANAAAIPDASGLPMGTFKSATVFVQADGFSASNITFENSYGQGSQALAINVTGDRATFRNCRFLGWQDTILLLQGRQYFQDCYIDGVVDFIFGAATAWFQHCEIHCLSNGYITAASTPRDHPYGFVFADCSITSEPGVLTYLGRPWRPYASVTFLNTQMSGAVRPEGWRQWNNTDNPQTARYSEWASKGPGAIPPSRVPWSTQLTDAQARAITIQQVLPGWTPTRQ
jgi:pectin methylesterase-like acyl-CoA thioesterase